jgi:sulfur-oxidizing protein SoxZ
MTRTLIQMPASAKKGEVIEIKAMVEHVMETGFRHTELGVKVPRDIIRTFTCLFNGEVIYKADFHPALVSNPVVQFYVRAEQSGNFDFQWVGDKNFITNAQSHLLVS